MEPTLQLFVSRNMAQTAFPSIVGPKLTKVKIEFNSNSNPDHVVIYIEDSKLGITHNIEDPLFINFFRISLTFLAELWN